MRGTLEDLLLLCEGIRFIPAHAGNTYLLDLAYCAGTVHPRACGEHLICRQR